MVTSKSKHAFYLSHLKFIEAQQNSPFHSKFLSIGAPATDKVDACYIEPQNNHIPKA